MLVALMFAAGGIAMDGWLWSLFKSRTGDLAGAVLHGLGGMESATKNALPQQPQTRPLRVDNEQL